MKHDIGHAINKKVAEKGCTEQSGVCGYRIEYIVYGNADFKQTAFCSTYNETLLCYERLRDLPHVSNVRVFEVEENIS